MKIGALRKIGDDLLALNSGLLTIYEYFPLRGSKQSIDQFNKCRFAAAVWTKQTDYLSARNGQ